MKKTLLITAALFIIIALKLDAKPEAGISFDFFYSSLQPYGEWINIDNDLVVWRPNRMHNRWRPYTEGRWCWTEDGWYWDSYEPFGWATYHYGRWYDDEYYGWIWIPDYEWAPSWVEWRYDDDYIGWAPLSPYASFHINFGIRFSIGWHSNYRYWNFVSYNRFCDRRLNNYYLDDRHRERIFGHTKYRTNYYAAHDRIINGGIDRSFIERKAGYRINEREISRVDNRNDYNRLRSDRGDRVIAYRPSDREIVNTKSNERYEIKRGENRTTLDRSKIQTRTGDERRESSANDRTVERNRDVSSSRDINRNENSRSRIMRGQNSGENSSSKVESNNRGRTNTRVESSNPERSNARNERQQVYNRPSRSERSSQVERPSQSERRQEVQRSERPSSRTEKSSKSENRNEKQSERSSDRRR